MKDTIFAQSSGRGKAGVAVFRLSGQGSMMALKQLVTNGDSFNPKPRVMYYKKIHDPENLELIDNAMIVYFKAPTSFTGEDVVEIYTHGSIAISKLLHNALGKIKGLRLAEAGEFAKRAFFNNKFDLTGAEGLADLIEAETIWQHRQATNQLGGALEKLYNSWRGQLLNIISLLEAYIDFPDEEIPETVLDNVLKTAKKLKNDIASHLADNRRGEILRNGIKLAIIGHPNVGKSSLLNFLMQREAAIVSNIAGTTRDIIEGHMDIGGYPIIIQDTAGIRSGSNDLIELEGIKRALAAAKNAEIKIVMLDAAAEENLTNQVLELIDKNTIIAANKIDLAEDYQPRIPNTIKISVKKGLGLNELLDKITLIAGNVAGTLEQPHITRQRHRRQLQQALEHLLQFNLQKDLVLATEDVRMAIRALSSIVGDITADEILGEIFSNFCIGK